MAAAVPIAMVSKPIVEQGVKQAAPATKGFIKWSLIIGIALICIFLIIGLIRRAVDKVTDSLNPFNLLKV